MKERPAVLKGTTWQTISGCGELYITINEHEGKPFEVFIIMGKAGGCASAQMESIGRLLSWGLRSGANIEYAIKSLKGIRCQEVPKDLSKRACADAITIVLEKYLGKGLEAFSEKAIKAIQESEIIQKNAE